MIMPSIIETNPEILGGKPIVKGTRVPVDLIYELVGLNYSIEYILDQYPSLKREALIQVIKIEKDARQYLDNVDEPGNQHLKRQGKNINYVCIKV